MKIIQIAFIPFLLSFISCAPSAFKKANQSSLIHKSSLSQFPKNVGSFERTTHQAYDQKGDDIGVGYQIREIDCIVTISLFVYPTYGRTLQQEFDAVNDAIEQYNEGAKIVKVETTYDFPFAGTKCIMSKYDIINGQTITYFFEKEDTFYKYRITFPTATYEKSEKEVKYFLNNFKW